MCYCISYEIIYTNVTLTMTTLLIFMQLMLKRAMDNDKITMLTNTTVETWLGDNMTLSGAVLRNENGTTFQVHA